MDLFIKPLKELSREASCFQPLETPTFSLTEFRKIDLANAYLFYLENIANNEPGLNRDMILQFMCLTGKNWLYFILDVIEQHHIKLNNILQDEGYNSMINDISNMLR